MYRRQLVAGLATTIPFIAGCTTLLDSVDDDDPQLPSNSSATTNSPEPVSPTTAETTVDETTQTTRTKTVPTTSIDIPTPTAIPTPTVTSTLTPPPTPSQTARSTPGIGTALIDPSNLATYTSDTYPFSVKYPASWRVDSTPTDPDRAVVFIPPSSNVGMQVNIVQNAGLESLKQNVRQGIKGFKQSVRQDGGTITDLERRNVTLPNGHRAAILNTLLTTPSAVKIRHMTLFTQSDGLVYLVGVFVLERISSPTVEQGMYAILTSFTIRS